MATRIELRHKDTGIVEDGYYGFSWTCLFFGFFPALFRSDYLTFFGGLVVAASITTMMGGLGTLLVWIGLPLMYNKSYTQRLLARGYELAGSDADNALAAAALGIAQPAVAA